MDAPTAVPAPLGPPTAEPVIWPGVAPPKPAVAGAETGFFVLLRNRYFLYIWLAQLMSQTAQNAINFAVVVQIERLTQSSTNVALAIVSFSVPSILLGPAAGVFVDHINKRVVLVATNALRVLITLGYLAQPDSLPAIYAFTFISSAVTQFFGPAEGAMIPLLVKRHQLISATSAFSLTFTASQVLGFVLLGPTIYKLAGPHSVFVLVAVLYALAASLVWLLPRGEPSRQTIQGALRRVLSLQDMREEFAEVRAFLRDRPIVMAAMAQQSLTVAVLFMLATLGPGFVARVLGLQPEDTGYVLAPAGVGIILSTLYLGHYGANLSRTRMVNGGLVAMAVTLALLALMRPGTEAVVGELGRHGITQLPLSGFISYLGLVGAITFLLGVEFTVVTIPSQTVVVENTEEELRGRIFSMGFMLISFLSALPVIFVGALADLFGITWVMLGVAAVIGTVGVGGVYHARAPHASDAAS